jgi:hypothetical protein
MTFRSAFEALAISILVGNLWASAPQPMSKQAGPSKGEKLESAKSKKR